ncbi:hypothetical protein BASA81_000719 [Batrachochytrium salamandrivorans]|nr:hypothetical protein BASA81_000719 [Batrachochytrium salamandrivorans]
MNPEPSKKCQHLHSLERWTAQQVDGVRLFPCEGEARALRFVKSHNITEPDFETKALLFLRECEPTKTRTTGFDLKYSTDVLKLWYFANMTNPYPNAFVKDVLAGETGMTRKQIQCWFSNVRKRYWLKSQSLKRPRTDDNTEATVEI